MTWSYSPGSGADLDRIRLLITDTDTDNQIFSNEEIAEFLAIEGDFRNASALGLETIASQEALILKVITVGDLQADGSRLAQALMTRAQVLRAQAQETSGDYAEMVVNDFSYRERLRSQRLRGV